MQVHFRNPRAYAPSPDLVQRMVRETELYLNRYLRGQIPRLYVASWRQTGGQPRANSAAR
jgi:hypothetical protein